jgi:hypothetical protein
MNQAQVSPSGKRTKTELLEEYNKLLQKYEELKMASSLVYSSSSCELMEKVKTYTPDALTKAVGELKATLEATLRDLNERIALEMQKLSEIQNAIQISKKNLELQYHVQVAAETLEQLVKEYGAKKQEFDREAAASRQGLEEEISAKKRAWGREQEEYAYNLKLQRAREEQEYKEGKTRTEQEIIQREAALKQQETELLNLRAQAAETPAKLQKALAEHEQAVSKRLRSEFEYTMELTKRDWRLEKGTYELKLSTLQEQVKRQTEENAALKHEAERANQKAQELAVKVVESTMHTGRAVSQNKEPAGGS